MVVSQLELKQRNPCEIGLGSCSTTTETHIPWTSMHTEHHDTYRVYIHTEHIHTYQKMTDFVQTTFLKAELSFEYNIFYSEISQKLIAKCPIHNKLQTSIDLDNGLVPKRCLSITWTNYDIVDLIHIGVPTPQCATMTSSNGNIFRVTGHLCGEFTGPRWIPRTKASDAELWCFLCSAPE